MALRGWTGRFNRQRRLIQLAFVAAFAVLPVFDLLRFDFTANRLHFFRKEIWLDEWAILWLALMLAMWIVGAAALILGRAYCAYACPQMIFSELAHDLAAVAKKLAARVPLARRAAAVRGISLAMLAPVSVAFSVLFMGYFAPLGNVVSRLAHLDVGFWVGLVGASTAVLFFLDFAFVKEDFCRSVCPYGLLQGILEDGKSLHVAYSEATGPCIDCGLCVKVCPMEIDIRKGSFQIECTRCGSCVDACNLILGKRKRPGLLAFRFGALGLRSWDAKRVLVGISTLGFAGALVVAAVTRQTLSFRLSPVYTEATGSSPTVETRFLLRATNKGKTAERLEVRAEGLPAAAIGGLDDATLPAGTEKRFQLVVSMPKSAAASSVTPFRLVVKAADKEEVFPAAFFVAGRRS